jgi:REP element-mobilizing transposase RayT
VSIGLTDWLQFYTFVHMKRSGQLQFFKKYQSAYGGELLKKRKARSRGRPLAVKDTMHMVLRSTKAKGDWSFKRPNNAAKIKSIVEKFSVKYGVQIISLANVGNHLHFHVKLGSRYTYKQFIRAVTSAIAMAITGMSRWKKLDIKFWDYRPFTRIVQSFRALLTLKDYIEINKLEGLGASRDEARYLVKDMKARPWKYSSA